MRNRQLKRIVLGLIALAAVSALVVFVVRYFQPEKDITEVSIGVEHAVTLRYGGPDLVLKPFARGVAVSMRIAKVEQAAKGSQTKIYDIRYILSREGEFDITSYLQSATNLELEGLPPFVVEGVSKDSFTIKDRIEEIESAEVAIWHWYYESLTAFAVFWGSSFFLLLFWHRHHKRSQHATEPDANAPHGVLRLILEQISSGELDASGKAKLEYMMLGWWRDHCGCSAREMHYVAAKLKRDPTVGEIYETLESWLHDPNTSVTSEQLIPMLQPYAARAPHTHSEGQ